MATLRFPFVRIRVAPDLAAIAPSLVCHLSTTTWQEVFTMRIVFYAGLVALLLTPSGTDARAQTAGSKRLGVSSVELNDVISGWSVQRQLLWQPVYNDQDEKIGKIEDIILNKERTASYAIVSIGGFLGLGSHDAAIPADQFQLKNNRLVLPGATRDQLRAMPPFDYSRMYSPESDQAKAAPGEDDNWTRAGGYSRP
jgi:PRC-barrel domain protein